jgi:hypothetical protein
MKLNICRYITIMAQLLGITVGCLLGMFPLLFIEDEDQPVLDVIHKAGLDSEGRMEVWRMKQLLRELMAGDERVDVEAFFASLHLQDKEKIDERECKHLYKSFLSLKSFETLRQEDAAAAALVASQ